MRTIYIYQNTLNNKIYVGQTRDLVQRKREHKFSALQKKDNYPFYNAIRKYGLDKFNIIEIENINDTDIDEAEQFWIQFFRSWDRNYGYNIDLGGCDNKIMSQLTKDKISVSNKRYYETHTHVSFGKIHTEESKQKMSEAQKGKKASEKTRQKLSKSHSGQNNVMFGKHHTDETKQKISNANAGKCYNTPEHMQKLHKITGDRLRGGHLSQEVKDKISLSHTGFRHTEESKNKMSETRKQLGTFAGENNPNFGKVGELNPSSKLTWEIVNNIRNDYNVGVKGKVLMLKYNISETNMYRILKNKTWKV
jgi:group I intron endonuclease